jgi:hypothetical protein
MAMMSRTVSITALFGVALLSSFAQAANLTVDRLRCEYRSNPMGIETAAPRLSWTLVSSERGQRQTAYRVLVATSPAELAKDHGDLWDSGEVRSDQSVHVPYAGKSLVSRQRAYWKVRAWDKDGKASPWSKPAEWTMGLLSASDWKAQWIARTTESDPTTTLPLLRRAFDVTKAVRRAEIYACGLGFHEIRLNGQKVGDAVLEPGWTNYRKSCRYSVYDVTDRLAAGRNALGVMLGNGMYNVVGGRYIKFKGSFGSPKVILQLHIDYADGTSAMIGTDDRWQTAAGLTVFSCIYGGEDYDARKELTGWDSPAFNAAGWQPTKVVESPRGMLVAESAPPIKVMEEFKTAKVTQPKPGVFVYDLGQNFSGWPQLTVEGPAGATVKMITSEVVDSNGLADQTSSGKGVWFAYTLKGQGRETWHPRFSYSGFRYVQVEGAAPHDAKDISAKKGTGSDPINADSAENSGGEVPVPLFPAETPRVHDLTGLFLHASAEVVGQFACSNPKINQVHKIIDAAILSNLQSVLTDCPHREKLGWLEVSQLLRQGLTLNYDLATFYAKICDDMQQAQTPEGLVTDIAPEYTVFEAGFRDSPEWGSAYVIDPWHVYQTYGDATLFAKHYEGMKKYVAYLGGKAKDHIVSHGLGDWADFGPNPPGESQLTSRGLTATATYYQDIAILEQVARLLGKQDDAARYAALAAEVRTAFNRAFFHADTNQYDRNSQTGNAMPLMLGLVEENRRAAVLDNLVKVLRANGNRVTAGDVGFMYLVRAVSDAGRGDVLYDVVCQEDGPGYMEQLKKGATTLTESWNAYPAWSQNHCMLGHAEEWFYRGLGGIQADPDHPGFKRFVIAPQIVGGLTSARTSFQSLYGEIASDWRRDGDRLTLSVSVPVNTTAIVRLPTKDAAAATESGKPVSQAEGVKPLGIEGNTAVYEVGPGRYQFEGIM